MQCFGCESILHLIRDFPYNQERKRYSKEVHVQLFAEEIHECHLEQFVGETLNSAVLDSICITSLWTHFQVRINRENNNNKFKFGDRHAVNSNGKVNLPVNIGGLC